MEKLAIAQANVLKFLKKGFKNKIVEIKGKTPFSKLMIYTFLLIPEQTLSECYNELLDKKKIFEMEKNNSKVTKKQESLYVTEKLLTFFNSRENGK
jgi:hypothetical protein